MDRGACRATVHEVTKSLAQLSTHTEPCLALSASHPPVCLEPLARKALSRRKRPRRPRAPRLLPRVLWDLPHGPPDSSSQGRRRTSSAQPGDPGRPLAIRMVGTTQEKNQTLTFYKWSLNTVDKTGLSVATQALRNRVTPKPW